MGSKVFSYKRDTRQKDPNDHYTQFAVELDDGGEEWLVQVKRRHITDAATGETGGDLRDVLPWVVVDQRTRTDVGVASSQSEGEAAAIRYLEAQGFENGNIQQVDFAELERRVAAGLGQVGGFDLHELTQRSIDAEAVERLEKEARCLRAVSEANALTTVGFDLRELAKAGFTEVAKSTPPLGAKTFFVVRTETSSTFAQSPEIFDTETRRLRVLAEVAQLHNGTWRARDLVGGRLDAEKPTREEAEAQAREIVEALGYEQARVIDTPMSARDTAAKIRETADAIESDGALGSPSVSVARATAAAKEYATKVLETVSGIRLDECIHPWPGLAEARDALERDLGDGENHARKVLVLAQKIADEREAQGCHLFDEAGDCSCLDEDGLDNTMTAEDRAAVEAKHWTELHALLGVAPKKGTPVDADDDADAPKEES